MQAAPPSGRVDPALRDEGHEGEREGGGPTARQVSSPGSRGALPSPVAAVGDLSLGL